MGGPSRGGPGSGGLGGMKPGSSMGLSSPGKLVGIKGAGMGMPMDVSSRFRFSFPISYSSSPMTSDHVFSSFSRELEPSQAVKKELLHKP